MDTVPVPYKGGGPAASDVVGGQIPLGVLAAAAALPHMKSGKLRALAVTSAQRSSVAPEVPTVAESGYPGFVTDTFAGLFAPAGTPKEVVDNIAGAVKEVMAKPEVIAKVRQAGFQPIGAGPEVLADRVRREVAFNHDIVAKAGIERR